MTCHCYTDLLYPPPSPFKSGRWGPLCSSVCLSVCPVPDFVRTISPELLNPFLTRLGLVVSLDTQSRGMGGYFEVQGDKPCWHYYCWLQRSIEDELDRESNSDIVTILISYLVMFAYITLFLGQFHSCDRILVSQHIPFSQHFFSSFVFPTPFVLVHAFSSVWSFLKCLYQCPLSQSCQPLPIGYNLPRPSRLYYTIMPMMKSLCQKM